MPVILGTSKSIYGFDPRSLGGCVLWLDGADATTLFSNADGSGGNSIVTGPVRRWKDKSGQGNDFSNRSSNPASYFPTRGSGGGVFIPNAGSPFYNATTYVCIQSVNAFFTFPYYTIFTVVNSTYTNQLGTLFEAHRSNTSDCRGPQWGLGGHFTQGSPGTSFSLSNGRWSFGEYNGVSGTGQYTGEAPPNGVTTVMGLTSGIVSNTISVAGTRTGSAASLFYVPFTTCALGPYQGGWFNTVGGSDNRWLNGTIFETLVFNSELTRMQCEEIEGYLSWKWGRQTALPTTHPFRNIAPLARGFTPIDIPGCQLWLDAAQDSTPAGGFVNTLLDRSGNGFNFTASVTNSIVLSNNFLNGRPVYYFGATTASNASFNWQTSFTQIVVVKTSLGNWLSSTRQNSTTYNSYVFSGNQSLLNVNNANGANNDTLVASGTSIFTTSPTGQTGWNIFCLGYTSGSTVGTNYTLNGNVRNTTAFTAVSTTAISYPMYLNGNGGAGGQFDTSYVAELIHYNTPLTNVQRQAVEGYLAHKWGLTASLSTSNSLRAIPPSSVQQFKPTDINACSLWLDGADISTNSMTFSSGSNISVWKDKSGNGSNATANTPIAIVSGFGGNTVLSVTAGAGTNQWLLGNIEITGVGLTVISAFRMESSSGGAARIIGLAATGADDYNSVSYVGILRQTNNNMGAFRAGWYAGPTLTYGVPAISTTYFDGTNGYSYINGGTASSIAATANFVISAYAVLANTNTTDAQYFTGQMGEMIVYNSTLTLAQRQQVEGYLSKKWAIPLATTHPYYAINPAQMVGGTAIITPSNLPGLIVWNRGDTLAVGNGNTINTWTNSSNASGPTITCTGTQSNSQLNGLSVANLLSNQTWTSSTALTPSSYTFIQVSRQTPSTYGRMFQSSVAGTNHLHGYWNSLKQPWYSEGWLGVAGGGIGSAENEWAIISSTRIQNGAFQNRWNGAVVAAGASSANVNLNGLAVNTGGLGSNETSTCQIAEVILYSNVLTTPQIIGIEEYLRQKWGLGLN